MKPQYNLIEESWIPCLMSNERIRNLGLLETLKEAHEIQSLGVESPLVEAGIYRLLLAILHSTLGPESAAHWNDIWEEGRFNENHLHSYLDSWLDRFYLFHPDFPFYQYHEPEVGIKTAGNLIQEISSGNNATLFDHHTDDDVIALMPEEAARYLIATQTFSLGGGRSGLKGHYFSDSPWARGAIFFLKGENLFQTLVHNLLPYPDSSVFPTSQEDRPTWEMENPTNPYRRTPYGYLDYLTWYARRIYLKPEQTQDGLVVKEIKLTQGMKLESDLLDPFKNYFTRGNQRKKRRLSFQEDRAVWRDSMTLLQFNQEGRRPPSPFQWAAELAGEGYLDYHQTKRYLAIGMGANQAKVSFYRSELLPLPLRYLKKKELVDDLALAIKLAEDVRRKLWGALRTLARFILVQGADQEEGHDPGRESMDKLMESWAVQEDYWSRLEVPFQNLMVGLPEDCEMAFEEWKSTVKESAWVAFERLAEQLEYDPRNMKATVIARGRLGGGIKSVYNGE